MQIETYECQEVTETVEQVDEVKAIVSSLGLEGQEKFYTPSETPVFPYRKMTAQEKIVYLTLLSSHEDLAKFGESAVPLRVLQVAAHASKCFEAKEHRLIVYHSPNADVKDPLLTLRVGSAYAYEEYILARWGEVLDNFNTLKDHAKKIWMAEKRQEIAEAMHKLQGFDVTLDKVADVVMETGKEKSVYLSI